MTFIDKIFIEKTNNIFLQFLRYTVVGGGAFICDFGLLFVLTEYGRLHYLLSALLAFIAGLTVNYLISVRWVFTQSRILNKKVEFLSYAVIGVLGLGLTELFMWIFVETQELNYMMSKLITTAIVYLWNFLMRKFFLF